MATPPIKRIISDLETGHLTPADLTSGQRVQAINFYARMARKWRTEALGARTKLPRLKATIANYERSIEVARAQIRDLELVVEKLKNRSKS